MASLTVLDIRNRPLEVLDMQHGHPARPRDLRRGATARQTSRSPAAPPSGDEGRLLATVISWNAVFSAANGSSLLLGAFLLDDHLGVDAWLLMGVGGGLVGFAGLLLWLLSEPGRLVVGARVVVAADVAWIVGAASLVVGFPSALSSTGRLALVAVSAAVGAFAAAQLVGLRRLGPGPVTGASPIELRVQRVVAAPVEQVWRAVADAGGYARFAPGIAATTIVAGEGEGMVRVCTDDRGGRWAESCTLWDEGTRYRMSVDVASYPVYYRVLLHRFSQTWTVEPVEGGTRLTLAFDGAVKLGILGRLAARLLGNPRRLGAILDAYERELTAARPAG